MSDELVRETQLQSHILSGKNGNSLKMATVQMLQKGMKASIYHWSMSRIILLGWILWFYGWCDYLFYILGETVCLHHLIAVYLFFQQGCLVV